MSDHDNRLGCLRADHPDLYSSAQGCDICFLLTLIDHLDNQIYDLLERDE